MTATRDTTKHRLPWQLLPVLCYLVSLGLLLVAGRPLPSAALYALFFAVVACCVAAPFWFSAFTRRGQVQGFVLAIVLLGGFGYLWHLSGCEQRDDREGSSMEFRGGG